MNMRIILFIYGALFLCGCVQIPDYKGEESAVITSSYPIVSVNGAAVEDTYKLDIRSGENTLDIVYRTYSSNYRCTFTWVATAGTAYEVTDQENRYPLTLYRWVRTNSLWANRLDPVDPIECTTLKRDDSVE